MNQKKLNGFLYLVICGLSPVKFWAMNAGPAHIKNHTVVFAEQIPSIHLYRQIKL